MINEENKYLNLLAKVLAKKASSEESEKLSNWTDKDVDHQAFVEDVTKTWDLAGNYAEDIPVDTDAAWMKFENKLLHETAPPQKTGAGGIVKFLKTWQVAVAAMLVVSFGLWWAIGSQTTTVLAEVATGAGEQKELLLPDGSIVMLNEHSSLSYNEDFENRKVTLTGEAFFDVTKKDGATFEIITNTTKTTVLGTSFNVRAYEDKQVEVAVFTGKVAVQELEKASNKVLLLPNESVVFDAATKVLTKGQKAESDNHNAIAWKTQELVFENTELTELVDILERYFDISIESENAALLKCHYTGTFSKPDLKEIFKAVAFSNDLEVKEIERTSQIGGNKYILIGQGCE